MKLFSFILTLALSVTVASAGEIDQDKNQSTAPQGVLVQVQDSTQSVTVFKADKKVSADAVAEIAKAENMIAQINTVDLNKKSEFDGEKSTQAWYYYYYGNYWNRSYFNYYYTPYTYYSYNYSYSYYRTGYSYYWYWY